jgi:micrococcal nuclease
MGNILGSENKSSETYSSKNMILNCKGTEEKSSPDLKDATVKNTPWFGIKDFTIAAKVVKVYDGDTCTCVFDTYGLGLYKHSVRLVGIDTPEIRGKSPEEKEAAIKVRDFVREKILGQIVNLECQGSDKYGRVLGIITGPSGEVINDLLVSNGMALKYDGGKKTKFVLPEKAQVEKAQVEKAQVEKAQVEKA